MDNRPIGVFDSGLGGLTAVRELRDILPGENIIYFGDTGRVPYGGRSRETITKYALQDAAFLLGYDIKIMIIACGTVSTASLDPVIEKSPVPVYGVVEPAARRAVELTKNGRIGVIGTLASISSGAYERELTRLMPGAVVTALACPLLVPLVEAGRIHPGDVVIETVCREYLEPIKAAGCDTLILGCTHYPLLTDIFKKILGPDVRLVSSGAASAHHAASELEARGMLRHSGPGSCEYYVSDSTEGFSSVASLFLRSDVSGSVSKVDIDSIAGL